MIVTHEEQLLELRRELTLRHRLYPGWVESGKLSAHSARAQIERLEAAILTLAQIAEQHPGPVSAGAYSHEIETPIWLNGGRARTCGFEGGAGP